MNNSNITSAILLLALAALLVMPAAGHGGAPAPDPADGLLRLPLSGNAVLAAGARFRHYRFALEFLLPLQSRIQLAPRGNFAEVRIRSLDSEEFFIYHTSFKIRRPKNLSSLADRISGPCPPPAFPNTDNFRVEARCTGRVGLNLLERRIIFVRQNNLLHLLYLTYRLNSISLADNIVSSIKINPRFHYQDF